MKRAVLLLAVGLVSSASAARVETVIVPVADVWSRPADASQPLSDDQRETQLLFGEQVIVHASSGPWLRIEAIEQLEFTHNNRWEGYPGWVRREHLSRPARKRIGQDYLVAASTGAALRRDAEELTIPFASHFKGERMRDGSVSPTALTADWRLRSSDVRLAQRNGPNGRGDRQHVLSLAAALIGVPYLWGGLSPAGLDCSGFVHAVFRAANRRLPRDAHDQWLKARPLKRAQAKPGDLLFSASAQQPRKITHVMLLESLSPDGKEATFLEAPQTGVSVRRIGFQEKYSVEWTSWQPGVASGDRVFYLGTFF